MSSTALTHNSNSSDDSFESFIDTDAMAEKHESAEPSSGAAVVAAKAASVSNDNGSSSLPNSLHHLHHNSLPNTPKMASSFSFGGTSNSGGAGGEPSLHDLSFDWEDMNHHPASASQTAAGQDLHAMPGMAYQHQQQSLPGSTHHHLSRRSFDDGHGQHHHSAFSDAFSAPSNASLHHGRSLSLSMHDVAPPHPADNAGELNFVPQTFSHAIKTEHDPSLSFDGEVPPPFYPDQSLFGDHSAYHDGATLFDQPNGSAPPQEKKRKIDGKAPAKKSNGKKKATSTTSGQDDQNMSVDDDASESVGQTESHRAAGSEGSPEAGSPKKAAPKAKKPPPSASQITESGKPFPVIDTSATHSSLFVPPDTSGLTKREARLVKNRAAAFLSRQRKREQFELLEKQCKSICRLTWRMWENIAGPDADVKKLEETILPNLLSGEAGDVRDCLEQIVVNKGASIAPTEESMANGTHDTQPQDSPAGTEANRASPSASVKSGSGKRDRADESTSAADKAAQDLVAQLRAELDAAKSREASLRAALAEERSNKSSSSSSSPSSSDFHQSTANSSVTNYTHYSCDEPASEPQRADDKVTTRSASIKNEDVAMDQPLFRRGRSAGSELSLTVQNNTSSDKSPSSGDKNASSLAVDDSTSTTTNAAFPCPSNYAGSPTLVASSTDAVRGGQQDRRSGGEAGGVALRREKSGGLRPLRPTSPMSRQNSMQGVASSGGMSASGGNRKVTSGMALLSAFCFGVALLGQSSTPGANDLPLMGMTRMAPFTSSSSSLESNIYDSFATGADTYGIFSTSKPEEEDEEMTSTVEGAPSSHLSADDLSLHLEASTGDESIEGGLDEGVADLLMQMTSLGASEAAGAKTGDINKSSSEEQQRGLGGPRRNLSVQNGFILLEEEDGSTADQDETLDPGSPRTLRLFLPQSTSPPSTSMDEEEIYEDAQSGDHLISDSDSEDDTTPRPSARVAEQLSDKEGAGPSFVELEFSYRGQRVVRSREEMTTRLRQAAATRSKRRR